MTHSPNKMTCILLIKWLDNRCQICANVTQGTIHCGTHVTGRRDVTFPVMPRVRAVPAGGSFSCHRRHSVYRSTPAAGGFRSALRAAALESAWPAPSLGQFHQCVGSVAGAGLRAHRLLHDVTDCLLTIAGGGGGGGTVRWLGRGRGGWWIG